MINADVEDVWEWLLATFRSDAAVGLLTDLFSQVDLLSQIEPPPQLRKGLERSHAREREILMELLSDQDGQTLRHWMHLFRDDRPAFDDLASRWVDEARERLFDK